VFEMLPEIVVFPKDVGDIQKLVSFVEKKKQHHAQLSLTPRSAGTDMSGGALTDSICVDMKHFNHIKEVGKDFAVVEPGTYYRDFEPETLKQNIILPCYTSSKLLCTVGGMVANNAAGEKSLEYGKTDKYVEELQMVLRDGNQYTFKKITKSQLDIKMEQQDFEGVLYENMFKLLDKNYDLIKAAKPKVSKNSSGYNIWNIWNKEEKT